MSGTKAEEIKRKLNKSLPIFESPERAIKALKILVNWFEEVSLTNKA